MDCLKTRGRQRGRAAEKAAARKAGQSLIGEIVCAPELPPIAQLDDKGDTSRCSHANRSRAG